ncbi:MAG: ABC transporter ATP-binding protein [Candidatus Paceibacterota bacterium]|jgi:ATP-binding cassette subfamily B protein
MSEAKMTQETEENMLSTNAIKGLVNNSWRLAKIIWAEERSLSIALIVVFSIVSAAPFLQSGVRGLLVNELVSVASGSTITSKLIWIVIGLILAGIIPAFLYTMQGYLSKLFYFFLGEKFELALVKKKGEIDIAVHEDPKYNDLFNKASENGVWRTQNFVDRQFYILQNLLETTIAAAVLIVANWWVFMIVLVGAIPELFVETRYGRQVWSIHTSNAETRRKFWDLRNHFDWLPSLVELRLFQNTEYFFSSIKNLFRDFREQEKVSEKERIKSILLAGGLSQAVMAFAAAWFVYEVVRGNLQIGTMTFLLASIGELRGSMSSLFGNIGRQYQDSLFVTDLFTVLDIKPVIKKQEKGIMLPKDKAPDIVFENVSFAYPGTNKFVLKDFSLKIVSGEKVAIVGLNGAGKTTFVKLLCRFYDPTKGRILVDGHDLKMVDLSSWYHHLGAIFQDYAKYHLTVKEAIAIGRTGHKLSIEKVKDAAKSSEADAFIGAWEKGYDQMLGRAFNEGVEPSIGQWQKLALARTFYRDPTVLILDEPTSSIDAEAEAKIFEKLGKMVDEKTVILISHRFSTVRQANKIVVIEGGKLREEGSHTKLIRLKGIYAELFKLQAKGYKG